LQQEEVLEDVVHLKQVLLEDQVEVEVITQGQVVQEMFHQ
jgi:hypothetical protein